MPVATVRKVEALRADFRSAAQLADMLGVSRSQVTRWLRGAGIDPLNAEKVDLLELVWSNLLRLYETRRRARVALRHQPDARRSPADRSRPRGAHGGADARASGPSAPTPSRDPVPLLRLERARARRTSPTRRSGSRRCIQGEGRHDNPDLYGCLYLADRAVSCVVEQLARFRGQRLSAPLLVRRGLPLALAELELDDNATLLDLDDPGVLAPRAPAAVAGRDATASRDAAAGARALSTSHPDAAGLRWWSSYEALWANVTVFDRAALMLRTRTSARSRSTIRSSWKRPTSSRCASSSSSRRRVTGSTADSAGSRFARDPARAPSRAPRARRGRERSRAGARQTRRRRRRRARRRGGRAPAGRRSSRGTAAADARCGRSGTPRGPRIRRGGALGVGQHARIASCARRVEERAVGLLRRMCEMAREAVEQDRRPAVHDRKRIAPQAQSETEPEVRGEQGIRTLARQIRSHARDPDHERVERLVELCAPQLHGSQQRLGVRDRRRAAECGRNRDLGAQRAQHVTAQHLRQRAVEVRSGEAIRSSAAGSYG